MSDGTRTTFHRARSVLAVQDLARSTARGANVLQPPTDRGDGLRELLLETPDGHRPMIGQTIAPR